MAPRSARRPAAAAAAPPSPLFAAGPGEDLSLSQAQDIDWDEVGYNDADAAQAASDRRRLQREMRSLIKQTTDDQTKFFDAEAKVVHTVLSESADLLKQTRQTTEAAIDAALVIRVSELAYKRTAHFLADRTDDTGVSLEDFVARCTDYMRFGRGVADHSSPALSRAQRKRRRIEAMAHRGEDGGARVADDHADADDDGNVDDDDEDTGNDGADGAGGGGDEKLDWTHFGQYACLPRTRRPGLARFLPCSLASADGKTRAMRKRTAALRLNELQEVRPQVLRPDDLGVSKNMDLTALAKDVELQLRAAYEQGQAQAMAAYEQMDMDETDEEGSQKVLRQLMDRHGLRGDGGVDLVRFAVNPQSFAQTVENFFYISFLLRDGRIGLAYDDDGLPSIYPIPEEDAEAAKDPAREDTQKHQLILSIDVATWRDLIATYNIRRSMIAHREMAAEAHPGGRAWFS